MNIVGLIRTGLLVVALPVCSTAFAAEYDPDKLTVSAASLLSSDVIKGKYYKIADKVLVSGYMNHYTVDSDFGRFAAVGDRRLKKLLHEIDAIAELREMTSASIGADAAVDAVADTGKSLAALVKDPEGTMENLGTGVSRLFKRASKTAKEVSASATEAASGEGDNNDSDQADVAQKLSSSYLGIGAAHRKIASELGVDPYSDNPVLQAELTRVAEISGSVGKVTNFLVPKPTVISTAANVSNMVWKMSPTDLLIQNQETLKALGYSDKLIQQFFSNEMYSPTEQTGFVAAVKSLDKVEGREVLLQNAAKVKTAIEGEFMIRSVLLTLLYHEQVYPVKAILSSPSGLIPVVITRSGDGIVFAPVDKLLWTPQVEESVGKLAKLMDEHGGKDEHLFWVEGGVSKLALANLKSGGWVQASQAVDKLEQLIKE